MLDIDANFRSRMSRPVENIVFAESPAPGRYTVEVKFHDQKDDTDRTRFPFTVTIIVDGRETAHDGTVETTGNRRRWSTTFDYAED